LSNISVLVLLLLGLASCGRAATEPRPDIVLITIDTLRKDHLSCYGYDRPTTPFIDDLAATGVLFANGYSTSCWTVPSVASLMTSLYPDSHGVVSGAIHDGEVRGQQVLSDRFVRLPELLKSVGYRTFGITANGHLAAGLGYDQGFDRYENLGFDVTAEDVNLKLEEWKGELQGHSPYFLWLHYIDPHAPYIPNQSWLSRYMPEEPVEQPERLIVYYAVNYMTMDIVKGSSDFDYILSLYDGEIGYTDDAIRRAVQLLDPESEALVIIASDHGEEFLDHHKFGHQDTLYEELIAIPLIIRLPGERHAGRIVDHPVSLVDIGPSLLDYLGHAVPEELQGESFISFVEGERQESRRPIFCSLARYPGRRIDAVIDGGWKFIRHSGGRTYEALYDLGADPEERTNVAGSNQHRKVKLTMTLHEELARLSTGFEPEIIDSEEERLEELRSLGYVE
jgi:arylsulfatase A-like enzyme